MIAVNVLMTHYLTYPNLQSKLLRIMYHSRIRQPNLNHGNWIKLLNNVLWIKTVETLIATGFKLQFYIYYIWCEIAVIFKQLYR